jgi:hypothetical protein
MNVKTFHFIRNAGLVAGAMVALSCPRLAGADKTTVPSDAFPNFDSYIKVSGQGASITGDGAAFQNRTKLPQDGGVGIEDLHYSKDTSKDVTLTIDGHALTGSEDYLGQVSWTKSEVGNLEIGYKRFRTFYDGVGGFFPLNSNWQALNNEVLNLDRSKFWIDATVALPNRPVFSIKYTNELRDGKKDSTIWGTTDFTGLPYNAAPIAVTPSRKSVASWINVDERHENVEFSVKHTIKDFTVALTVFHDETANLDTRYVLLYPGENLPFPTPSAAAIAALPPTKWHNQVQQQQTDGMATKTTGVTGKGDLALIKTLKLSFGGAYQVVRNDISGDRPLTTWTPTASGVQLVNTDNNYNLLGGSAVKVLTGNVALDWNVTKDLFAKLAFKGEEEYIRGSSTYTVVAASGTPAVTLASTPRLGWAKLNQNSSTPVLEVRYTGIKDVSLYFNGSQRSLSGTEKDTSHYNFLTAQSGTLANNNVSEDHGDYALGCNWRQSRLLTVRAELFQKNHQTESAGFGPNVGDYYLLDNHFKGVKLTGIVKPVETLAFTARYVHQTGKMQVTGYLPTYPAFDSCNAKNDIIAGSVDWNPSKLVYAQANVNVVYNNINTIYPRAGITVATSTVSAYDTNRVLQDSKNNYVTTSFLLGFVLDKHTDLQAQYTDYRANNGDPALAALTMPYGVSAHDYMATVGIKHQINDKLVITAKIGYANSNNDTTGGLTNYKGPLAYVSIEHAL